jgi:hypothetical protein
VSVSVEYTRITLRGNRRNYTAGHISVGNGIMLNPTARSMKTAGDRKMIDESEEYYLEM